MKKQLIVITSFLCFAMCAYAEKRQEYLDKLLQKRSEYISSQIGLTEEEKEKFIPLYEEYQEKQIKLFKWDGPNYNSNKGEKNYTEEDFRKKNESYIDEKLDRATLERIYYEKFREILSESKIYNMYKAERAYKQDLLKQIENKRKEATSTQDNK